MTLAQIVFSVMALSWAGAAVAAEGEPRRANSSDASRRLAEAVRTGTFDAADAAVIVEWVLNEREDKVARGFADALRLADLGSSGQQGKRWDATAHAMVGLFARALGDAAAWRRTDGSEWSQVAELVKAAAPAAAAALSEADPAAREQFLRILHAAAPAGKETVPALVHALRHDQPEVRSAAAVLLGAMGPAARAAAPELKAALGDGDAAVREAAAHALEQIEKR